MAKMNTTIIAEDEYLNLTVVKISAGLVGFYRVAYQPPYEPMFDVEFFTTRAEAMAHFDKMVAEDE